jgi:hypothetical protein
MSSQNRRLTSMSMVMAMATATVPQQPKYEISKQLYDR